jgi:PTS system fructose-specific IIC component
MGSVKDGSAPIFSGDASESSESEKTEDQGSVGHKIYTWLMNGVSHMLPFVIGGGILVAIAFLIDTIAGYGATGGGDFGSITPLAALLKYIGGLAMGLMVPVLAGYIAYAIADRPGLAVGFVGGMLASNGNALLSGYTFAEGTLVDGKAIGGFGEFLSKFAFQQPDGGNTVSGFLGGIVAGFLAGFIVLGLQKLCANLPQALDGIKPTLIYPLVGIFLEGVIMCFMLNPLIGLANTGLSHMLTAISDAGMLTVLGLILGAMMAIDMGGPINKAAYVFGVGMLTQASDYLNSGMSADDPKVVACYVSMAAIMVGGMVPPVGIALACWIFPKKFTKAERGSAVSNVVMGASFITEGAIPFAAADPLHTIPCTMVGAGVAGFLAALFKCTLMAPHGGLFVFATVGNPFMYIVAWLVGSAVTCIMLGLIKKPAEMN